MIGVSYRYTSNAPILFKGRFDNTANLSSCNHILYHMLRTFTRNALVKVCLDRHMLHCHLRAIHLSAVGVENRKDESFNFRPNLTMSVKLYTSYSCRNSFGNCF